MSDVDRWLLRWTWALTCLTAGMVIGSFIMQNARLGHIEEALGLSEPRP